MSPLPAKFREPKPMDFDLMADCTNCGTEAAVAIRYSTTTAGLGSQKTPVVDGFALDADPCDTCHVRPSDDEVYDLASAHLERWVDSMEDR